MLEINTQIWKLINISLNSFGLQLHDTIVEGLNNKKELENMSKMAKANSYDNALDNIVREIINVKL